MDCPKCGLTQEPADECRGCGVIIARYKPAPAKPGRKRSSSGARRQGGQQHETELLTYYEAMHQLVRAGLTPVAAHASFLTDGRMVTDESPYQRISQSLARGHTFSEGMAASPGFFPLDQVALVRAGEQAGDLPGAFLALSGLLHQSLQTRARIKKLLRQPALTLLAAVFVLPLSRLVANGPGAYALAILPPLLVLAALWLLIPGLLRSLVKGKAGLSLSLVMTSQVNSFARAFHTLYRAGIPMADAFATAAATCSNEAFSLLLKPGATLLRQGATLACVVRESGHFPPDFVQLVSAGEHAGALEAALEKYLAVAEARFDQRLSKTVHAVTAVITLTVLCLAGWSIVTAFTALLPES